MAHGASKQVTTRASSARARAPVVRKPAKVPHRTIHESRHARLTLLQPALKVGAAHDPLEREAENNAERIVAMPVPAMETTVAASDGQPSGCAQRASTEDQPNLDTLETAPPIPADQQDPEVPKAEDVDTSVLGADDMKEIETGNPEDTGGEVPAAGSGEGAAAGASSPPPQEEATAQPARPDGAVVGAEGGAAPADVAARVNQPGRGRSLPDTVRAFMEPRFGYDFSDVRIHDTPADREAAMRIGARAFTHREHIWLGPDERVDNRRLMAHELTHVVQQTRRQPANTVTRETRVSEEGGEPEVRRGYVRNKIEKYARKVPGYRLITVILGKSPITGNKVERNATNLIGALLALIPGGGELFDRLVKTRVLQEAFDWIKQRLSKLNITWSRIKGLINELIDYMPALPSNAIRKAKSLFAPLFRDILTFIKDIGLKILEFIIRGALKLAGPWADKVWGVFKKAGSVIGKILKDPLGFAKNLLKAVVQGFRQFSSRVFEHLKRGLLGWLFGAIQGLDIKIPDKLDFKGLISIGLQVVGLTYENFRTKLVKRLAPNGERKVGFIEKSVEVVKILIKKGFVGLWQRVLQMIDGFKETIIGGIKTFVIESLIKGGLGWLAGLTNPAGAIIKVVLAIYNIVKTFLERLEQIMQVAKSIFSSIALIAVGKIQQAANFVEKSIAATIPVVISFLAALVPITGITNAIRNIIKRLRTPVDKAMDKMIGFLVKKAKKIFARLIGRLNKKRKLPAANFKIGEAQHRMYAEQKGKSVSILIASSKGKSVDEVKQATRGELGKLKGEEAKRIGGSIDGQLGDADKETTLVARRVDLDSKKANMNKPLKDLQKEVKEGARELSDAGRQAATNPEVDAQAGPDSPALYRFKEPRDPAIEGKVGTYAELRKDLAGVKMQGDRSAASFYEIDHIIEKQIPKAILENLRKLDPARKTRADMAVFRVEDRRGKANPTVAAKQTMGAKNFAKIGTRAYTRIGDDAPQFPAIILYRPNHIDAGKLNNATVMRWIKQASENEDPHGTLKELLRTQLTRERDNVAKAYQKDEDTTPAIDSNINNGLGKVETLNNALYELGEGKRAVADASKKSPEAVPKSKKTFTGANGAGPNFTDLEGGYGPYEGLPVGFGKYLEKDHIVEKSFPLRAQALRFGSSDLWDKIKHVKPNEEKAPSHEDHATRKARLRKAKIFSAGGVSTYTVGTGKAMIMYRPIHRAVSAKSPAAKNNKAVLPDDMSSVVAATGEYLQTGEDSALEMMRHALKHGIKKKAEDATKAHAHLVEKEYDKEIKNVKAANAEGGPDAMANATAEMQKIINNVKANLSEARSFTTSLFS